MTFSFSGWHRQSISNKPVISDPIGFLAVYYTQLLIYINLRSSANDIICVQAKKDQCS